MLVHLSISNYAIVEQLDLELTGGMTAITGETGAGKSIMLDALGLALGDRTDASAVRPGAERADILATFDISSSSEARSWLAERDLDSEGPCILRRVITAEGRSRAYINGTPCPLADLKTLGELLIDIHSQHEHQSLLKPDNHRRLLDACAGSSELARQIQQTAQRWRQTRSELERLTGLRDEQDARLQLLRYQLDELENLALAEGELQQLEQEQQTLAGAEGLLADCRQALELCSDSDHGNVLALLGHALQRLGNHAQPPAALGEAAELLESARIQIGEACTSLTRFSDHFEADPARLQQVEERLDSIYRLARKHRIPPQELPALQDSLQQELRGLDASDESIAALEQRLQTLQQEYDQQAAALSARRQQAASGLAGAVEQEMQRLGMPGGRFAVQLQALDSALPQPHGSESVEFLVSANPGQPLRPLGKVASGGELSRISLAIQVINAQNSRIPTLVFDEVDVGIGGPTAEVVGQLLRRLGERGQVLTVTHLPQVAAQGHQHLFVHKQRDCADTRTAVARLDEQQRVEEVARMLGGIDLCEESLAHARRMVQAASSHLRAVA